MTDNTNTTLTPQDQALLDLAKEVKELKSKLAQPEHAKESVDPVFFAKSKIDEETNLRKKIEAEIELKSLAKNFDEKYSSFFQDTDLKALNSAEMNEDHRFVRKVKELFKNKQHVDLLPYELQPEIEKITKLNHTEEATYNIADSKVQVALKEFDRRLKEKEKLELELLAKNGFKSSTEEKSRIEKLALNNSRLDSIVNILQQH